MGVMLSNYQISARYPVYLTPVDAFDADQTLSTVQPVEPRRLGEIHDLYYPVVYRYVRFRLEDEQACEDIASEVFLRLVDSIYKQNKSIHNPRGWLLGTASHLVNDHLRARYHHAVSTLEDDQPDDIDLPEAAYEQASQLQSIRVAIRKLTDEQQHVLALRFAGEYSLEETARLMGKSIGAIKTLQFRALGSLRKLVGLKEK